MHYKITIYIYFVVGHWNQLSITMALVPYYKWRVRCNNGKIKKKNQKLKKDVAKCDGLLNDAIGSLPRGPGPRDNNDLFHKLEDELDYVKEELKKIAPVISSSLELADKQLKRDDVSCTNLKNIQKGNKV